MTPILSEDTPAARPVSSRRVGVVAAAIVLLVIAAVSGSRWLRSRAATRPTPQPARSAGAAPRAEAVATGALEVSADLPGAIVVLDGQRLGAAPRSIAGLAAGPHSLRVELAGYEPWQQEAHVVPGVTTTLQARLPRPARLRVESDVPEASVFVDQKYVGRTPLELHSLAPGPHQLRVAAEGFDMYAETFDAGVNPRTVGVRFKDVHLDASLAAVHRHSLGSCSGRLSASPSGLRYETAHTKDAFDVPLEALERLEVDYLRKNLAVRIRAGRTHNFTVASGNADPLLAFQQKVERARRRQTGAAP